ncbi:MULTISPECIES: hypothetical protein [unclassified Acidovorax]|uniref:hypothetical protein n=1 Tax=unclassified Acidovorax TaxID=2684926 RepID=UPI000C18F729|nr:MULTISPECIES: hypothetical protein [unclassified Acidovorax]PIF20010.1 hypothetical protein CLU87_3992 [Acidovorax sp. 59]PKW00966.1 hypothetical protein CLU89_0570 [Acidovorax sp. 30]
MPTLFFMPWTYVEEAGQVGPIAFVPYEREACPGPLGDTTQRSLDAIIGNYADRAFAQNPDSTVPVRKALILRWAGDNERKSLLIDREIQERLEQTQLLTFAALSARQFGMHRNYCNADSLIAIAQHFSEDNPAATAITTRRRDGNSMNYMTGGTGKPLFLRPLHVSERYSLNIDNNLALALLNVPDGHTRNRILDAITLFNKANTDSNDVPPSAEIVFMRAALETLLGASHKTSDLKAKLVKLLAPHLGPVKWHNVHIEPSRWQGRWKSELRPFSAWIEDFCHWRNEGAHGKTESQKHPDPVWSLWNHLLFTSWLMGRIVKVVLANEGLYTLTSCDKDELQNVELFFAYDITARDAEGHMYWQVVLTDIHYVRLGRELREV